MSAEIRRCESLFLSAVVVHRGDDERGLILIKKYVHNTGARIFTQSRDLNDTLTWHQPLGDQWIEEAKADQYITRQRDFDDDLWVVEVDDPKDQYAPEFE